MNIATPLLVLGCVALALLSIQLPKYLHGAPALSNRYASIDGLRGYLGFFVFLHHAAIWQGYVRTGVWTETPSRILNHFGQTSVLLFFMITGFLFMNKLVRTDRPIDWLQLFVGRLMRLGPLYAVAMMVLAVLVLCSSGITLNQEPSEIARGALKWAGFAVFGAPDMNGVANTNLIMAGVTWTLPYEWMFYLALPAIALLLNRRVSLSVVATSALLAGSVFLYNHKYACLLAFMGGVGASYLVRLATLRKFASTRSATILAATCLLTTMLGFDTAYKLIPTMLVATAFTLIASGNALWGALTTATSRLLGDCSYGLYLLHGFLLYVTYEFIIGKQVAADFSPVAHWFVAMACTPVLVLVAYATFRWIEVPAMRKTNVVTAALRRRAAVVATA